jgi:hypothetical protein
VEELIVSVLNVYGASDVRQIEILHTAEFTIAKLKKFKSPDSDQIWAELIQAGGEILCSKIHRNSVVFSPPANYTDRAIAACQRS